MSLHICQAEAISSRSELTHSGMFSDGIAMNQHQHLRVVETAQRDAEKVADADVDRHPHALDGTVQHDAFAMKFDLPHAAVCAGIVRMEAERKRKRVEPHARLDPAGLIPLVAV